jgi:signal transduction histidine kinase
MRELSRLDAVALNQQKTTFVASISHELRSPLHGILGTLEFIKDTPRHLPDQHAQLFK